jgi:hypothetical protein
MGNLSNRLETLANAAIIIVALMLGVVLVKRFILNDTSAANQPSSPGITVGEKVTLAGAKTAKPCSLCSPKTVIFAKRARPFTGN